MNKQWVWSAAYICNVGTCIARALGCEDQPAGEPCIILVDSLRECKEEPRLGINTASIQNLILALVEGWYAEWSGNEGQLCISNTDLPVIQPESPQQPRPRLVDCGGFVMKNTQQIIQALPRMEEWTKENVRSQVFATITPTCFTLQDVQTLRASLFQCWKTALDDGGEREGVRGGREEEARVGIVTRS